MQQAPYRATIQSKQPKNATLNQYSSTQSSNLQPQLLSSHTSSDPTNNLVSSLSFKVQYQKNNLIGKGTFGRVYTALDLQTGGLLAVKSIKLTNMTDARKRQQELNSIENEVNVLKNLEHPNIVKYMSM